MSDLKNLLKSQGFFIINNVLTSQEIKNLRRIVNNHFLRKRIITKLGFTQPNAAVEVPEICWIFYHPKILAVMGQLLGNDSIMFTSHCDIHSRTLSGWHKDDGMTVMKGGYFGYPTYQKDDCQVYKVAIYLQDHRYNTGGLTVKKGSHKFPELDKGENIYLKTKAGDIVVFDVRLTHTGQQSIAPYKILEKPSQLLQKSLDKAFKIPPQKSKEYLKTIYAKMFGERLSIFFTYGSPDEYTKSFAINNMKRQLQQSKNTDIFLAPETRKQFINRNVLLAEDYFTELTDENSS